MTKRPLSARAVMAFPAALFAMVLVVTAGCGGVGSAPPVSSSNQEVQITGRVFINGKPAKRGEVVFDPANYMRNVPARTATIDDQGRYQITTLTGQNIIQVNSPDFKPNRDQDGMNITVDITPELGELDLQWPPPDIPNRGDG
ncbi:hypothetical protein Isop_2038 [Isosphaera pallida ATCC 43644]|uniref:Carboxypeptidase regulatory-like domain-containing protein n=1 Tax=Isosphaera pallida (strain ATCC 43644 / DSM 9630 / IS1B) TaxID=575540 RepID=E8R3N3_ISOPI|nr:hypothetical protein [Isosphaera pallida]ADV62618.1 hypothetical protein Isop_2038 [Isosphaera pallida ATCC 43644]